MPPRCAAGWTGARRRHGLEHRSVGRSRPDRAGGRAERFPGTEAGRRRPERLDRGRVGEPGKAPAPAPYRTGRRPVHAALAPAHGRCLAGVREFRPLDRRPGPPDPGGAADRRQGRCRLPPARVEAGADRPGTYRDRPSRPRPARGGLGSGRGGPADAGAARPGHPTPCWISATWPASATCTRRRRCSCAVSRPGRRYPTWTTWRRW